MILLYLTCGAQQTGNLTIHGKVKYKTSLLDDVKIEVYKDNQLQQEAKSLRNGSFRLDLKLGSIYNVTYLKKDFIEKSVAVIARADSSLVINGRFYFQLDIELYKEGDGQTDNTVLPPVAKLYIKDATTGFSYDKKYVRWISDQYEEALEDEK
jgi:hypothetical protein